MAVGILKRIVKYRRFITVRVVIKFLILGFLGYVTVKLKGYGPTQVHRREKPKNSQFPWQQFVPRSTPASDNITNSDIHFLNVSSRKNGDLVQRDAGIHLIKLSSTKEAFERVERYKNYVFRKEEEFREKMIDNNSHYLQHTAQRSEDQNQISSKDYRLTHAKMLQRFEEWKLENKAILSDRTVSLKLPPPPHVNDSLVWKHMVESFPLVFRRLMKPFFPDYKNPCFHAKDKEVYCLPYFIEIGAAKCGSTDLYYHITRHPKVVRIYKEAHFWTHMDKTDAKITQYLKSISKFNKTVVSKSDKETLIFGDGSPSYFWENYSIQKGTGGSLPFLWADVIQAVMPGTKIIAILRNPTNRTISDYYYSGRNQSPIDFHTRVQQETTRFNKCQKTRSLKACANGRFYPRLNISVYIAHILQWLRLFRREQVLIIRTEDWHNHTENNLLQEIFKFLEIDELPEAELPDIEDDKILAEINKKKATKKKSEQLGDVLPETRAILDNFFEPYNRQLADLLADDKFLWND